MGILPVTMRAVTAEPLIQLSVTTPPPHLSGCALFLAGAADQHGSAVGKGTGGMMHSPEMTPAIT